jgi:hypothetical protein
MLRRTDEMHAHATVKAARRQAAADAMMGGRAPSEITRAYPSNSVRPFALPALPLSGRELRGDVRLHLLQQNLSLLRR